MSRTLGLLPGAVVDGDGANVPPGAVEGRGGVITPFHGHIVSASRWPTRLGLAAAKERASAGFVRRWIHCHTAQRRSTFAWSMKKSGSRAAVCLERMKPKLVRA